MVVCIISEWFLEAANHTCGAYDPSVDEMDVAGLTPLPSEKVIISHEGEGHMEQLTQLRTDSQCASTSLMVAGVDNLPRPVTPNTLQLSEPASLVVLQGIEDY